MDTMPVGKFKGVKVADLPTWYIRWFTLEGLKNQREGNWRLPESLLSALRFELETREPSAGIGKPPGKADNLQKLWVNIRWAAKQMGWLATNLNAAPTTIPLKELAQVALDLAHFTEALSEAITEGRQRTKEALQRKRELEHIARRPALLAKLTKEVFGDDTSPENFEADKARAAEQLAALALPPGYIAGTKPDDPPAAGRGAAEGGDAKLHLDAPETLDVLSAPPPAASQPAAPGGEPSAVGDAWEKADVAGSPKWELDLSKPPPELDWKRPAAGGAQSSGQSSLPAGGSTSPAAKSAGTSRKRKSRAAKRPNLYTPHGRVACGVCGGSGGVDETCTACGGSGWETKATQ